MNTVVYNYSGTNQTLNGFVLPPGGPFPMDDVLNGETHILIDPTGTLVGVSGINPDHVALYFCGFQLGIALAGAILCFWIIRMVKS